VQYGYFDDSQKEYVITRPDTPRSWSNYLGTTEYGAIITNHAGGYSFYKSAAQGKFTRLVFNAVPADQPGRYFYLLDRETGEYWSASWQPVGKDLEQYRSECRHGTAYTVITSAYAGIETEATYFVPLGASYEVWILRVKNASDRRRRLGVFSCVELVSEWHTWHDQFNLQYSQYIVRCELVDEMIAHATCPNLPEHPDFENRDQSRHTFLALIGAKLAGFDTDREAFLGRYRTYRDPAVVERGRCTGSVAQGDNAVGVFQVELELGPGEEREFAVLLGVGRAQVAGRKAREEMGSVAQARRALDQLKAYWHSRLGALMVKTPDPELDSMLNVWNAYNCLITFAWSRAASLVYAGERDGLGYRDTVQDILGVLPAIPEQARERLELMLAGQVSSGGALPVVKQFAHRPGFSLPPSEDEYRADDCLWLFNTVPSYVKETGELGFFHLNIPYADQGEATVLGHLRRAIEFNLARRGAHGLPCGLAADWNDCLRLGARGESVFVAFQLRYALSTYAEIADLLTLPTEANWARAELADLDRVLESSVWDGQWYIRAFRADGSPIGSHTNSEGSIHLNAQSWAVLSGAATPEQAMMAMDAVEKHLATEYGIALCEPPYRNENVSTIRSVLFNPGMKENAGIFCHPQGWAVIAETLLGRGDRAYRYYRAYLPAAYNTRAEVRQIEPYVHCQSTHGKWSRRFGASRLPWLSGTASWAYVAGTQYLLGIRPDWNGLKISPVIPSSWDGFTATRRFRGASYHITVKNPDHVQAGVRRLTVDGRELNPDSTVPVAPRATTTTVEVILGSR
jgi:N,N'-diacetylchitobiose phosphorylase